MVTVVNTPSKRSTDENNAGLLVTIIVLALLVILFVVYGVPLLRGNGNNEVNTIPTTPGTTGSDQINVPIDTGTGMTETESQQY